MSFHEEDRSDPNFRWRSFSTDWREVDMSVSLSRLRRALSKASALLWSYLCRKPEGVGLPSSYFSSHCKVTSR